MGILPFITTALTWLGRIGLAAFAVNEVRTLASPQKTYIDQSHAEAQKVGVTPEDTKKLIAATTYDKIEQGGGKPDDFWAGLSPEEKANLQFSPQSLRESMGRTHFLGIASTFLFAAAAVASGIGAARGIPIALSTLAKIREARAAGASALSLMTIFEEGKIAGLAKVWVPGFVAGIAGAGGWLTSGMTNNMNDTDLWGRIFLGQASEAFTKAADKLAAQQKGTNAQTPAPETRTRLTISRSGEPKIAVGTLFQSIVRRTDAFERVVDDAITSPDDLKTDVQLNLNKWLTTLPGRLYYEIRIVLNPLDEMGIKRQGTWAMLMIGHRNMQGVYAPLSAVALGPIEPTVYRPSQKDIQTIQLDIPKLLTSEEVVHLDMPTYGLRTVDKAGNITPIMIRPAKVAYDILENRDGIIFNTAEGFGYKNPQELAAALGVETSAIQWDRIRLAAAAPTSVPTATTPPPAPALVPAPTTPPPAPALVPTATTGITGFVRIPDSIDPAKVYALGPAGKPIDNEQELLRLSGTNNIADAFARVRIISPEEALNLGITDTRAQRKTTSAPSTGFNRANILAQVTNGITTYIRAKESGYYGWPADTIFELRGFGNSFVGFLIPVSTPSTTQFNNAILATNAEIDSLGQRAAINVPGVPSAFGPLPLPVGRNF